jgi:hypothetical protein
MKRNQPIYGLSITFADHEQNTFVELGGAAWKKTRKEQLAQWNNIPAASDKTCLLLDKRGANGFDIEDTKCILAETIEFLLGEPIAILIERGRRKAAKRRDKFIKRWSTNCRSKLVKYGSPATPINIGR